MQNHEERPNNGIQSKIKGAETINDHANVKIFIFNEKSWRVEIHTNSFVSFSIF